MGEEALSSKSSPAKRLGILSISGRNSFRAMVIGQHEATMGSPVSRAIALLGRSGASGDQRGIRYTLGEKQVADQRVQGRPVQGVRPRPSDIRQHAVWPR